MGCYGDCYCTYNQLVHIITTMKYLGNGKWKCPECGTEDDCHDIVYRVRLKFERKELKGTSWIEVSIIEPYDERLNAIPTPENPNPVTKLIIEESMNEDEFGEEHELGVFDCDLLYNWHNDYSPEYGNSWDLDMEIIQEEKLSLAERQKMIDVESAKLREELKHFMEKKS